MPFILAPIDNINIRTAVSNTAIEKCRQGIGANNKNSNSFMAVGGKHAAAEGTASTNT